MSTTTIIEDIRESGVKALGTVLNIDKNIKVIERCIWDSSNGISHDYNRIVYKTIGDIIKKKKLKDVLSGIKNNETLWNHSCHENEKMQIAEQDDFIEHPFEVEEGVLQCKCGSKKVYSYSKQTRSADEPMTTYAECVVCNKKWQYSG